ncbi:MAG: TadE/TadG family type IV pilus assembly protein [Acidimicrobiales bacterium]
MRRCKGERGATLVESAIITPVLMLFLFGIFEFGFAFRDYLTVANAARDGAREVSVAGNAGDADYRMLRAIARASASLPDDAIEQIIVFKATGPGDTPDPSCLGGSQTDLCNVYTASDFTRAADEFGCNGASTVTPNAPDDAWCPTDREVSVGTGLDYVGVWITTTHTYITGLFGSSIDLDDQLILKVEPQDQ